MNIHEYNYYGPVDKVSQILALISGKPLNFKPRSAASNPQEPLDKIVDARAPSRWKSPQPDISSRSSVVGNDCLIANIG
jgi:hypothetical protein